MLVRLAILLCVVAGCHRTARPTLTGAALYAEIATLRDLGTAKIVDTAGLPVQITTRQYLVTEQHEQTFVVGQMIANCRGGDAEADDGCALAVLLDRKFHVHDPEEIVVPGQPHEEETELSGGAKAAFTLLGIGAALTYGAVACEFDGCKELFGVAIGLDLLLLLLITVGLG